MKIACITVFCNEAFRLDNWKRYYSEYKDNIALHVIVNNGNSEDSRMLKNQFPHSVVLESPGANLLRAYNVGTKFVLQDKTIDAVMQVTNDIKFQEGAIANLYKILYSEDNIAIVGPVLLGKDSDRIEVFGIDVKGNNLIRGSQIFPYRGGVISDIRETNRKTAYVSAGIIMQKRCAIEQMGFQDESINMYCDERDMAIRLRNIGYCEVVTKSAVAWHQHINKEGKSERSLFAPFYSARNYIYLVRKYSNLLCALWESVLVSLYWMALIIYHLFKGERFKISYDLAVITGTIFGLFRKMNSFPKWLMS